MNHARSTYPEECCGFLLGVDSGHRTILRALAAQNVNEGLPTRTYNINPTDLVRADEEARRSNLELIGIYHSHPDVPPQPSQVDLEHAWPWYTYLVLSLQNGEPTDVAAWALSQDRSTFHLDDLRVIQD
jgi:proteasome lid subunit RPN8/RPN11